MHHLYKRVLLNRDINNKKVMYSAAFVHKGTPEMGGWKKDRAHLFTEGFPLR